MEERLGDTLEYSALCCTVKWAMTVEILRMDDASAKEWFGLAWNMFVCAPAVPEVSLLGLHPFRRTVKTDGGVKFSDVVSALREYIPWWSGARDLRMTEARERALDDRLSRLTLRPCRFLSMSVEETYHLLEIATKGKSMDTMDGAHIALPASWAQENYWVRILTQQ